MSGDSISLRTAADNLGLHYMTVYRYVRTGKLAAVKRGGQWFVDPDDLGLLRIGSDPAARDGSRSRAAQQLEARMLAADEAGAWAVVSQALTSGAEPAEIHLRMLIPAMRAIGDAWERGDISVFDEHQATVIATRITARLGPRFHRRGRPKAHAIVGLVSGDPHALASGIIADLLRGRGFAVTDLGADTPAESFIEMIEAAAAPDSDHDGGADLVGLVISSSMSANATQVASTIAAITSAHPHVTIALGGSGIGTEAAARELGATIWRETIGELLDTFDELAARA
jgi:excisionase family DNA binding protein